MAGERLILLPGRLCDERLYRFQLTQLAHIAQLSVGDVTRSDDFGQIARDILATAPPRFALAGLSFGGIVALEIVRQAPERVSRLALLDCNPGGNTPRHIEEFEAQTRQAYTSPQAFLKLTTELFYPQMVHPARLADASLLEEVVAMARAVGVEAFGRQNTALKHRIDRWDDLPYIECPTLVLCGKEDKVCPPALHEEMALAIPHSDFAVIDDCGHLSTMEQPERVTLLLTQWLSSEARVVKYGGNNAKR